MSLPESVEFVLLLSDELLGSVAFVFGSVPFVFGSVELLFVSLPPGSVSVELLDSLGSVEFELPVLLFSFPLSV